jgi:hypothetical protein
LNPARHVEADSMTTYMIHLYYIAWNSRMGEVKDENIYRALKEMYFDGTECIFTARNVF